MDIYADINTNPQFKKAMKRCGKPWVIYPGDGLRIQSQAGSLCQQQLRQQSGELTGVSRRLYLRGEKIVLTHPLVSLINERVVFPRLFTAPVTKYWEGTAMFASWPQKIFSFLLTSRWFSLSVLVNTILTGTRHFLHFSKN